MSSRHTPRDLIRWTKQHFRAVVKRHLKSHSPKNDFASILEDYRKNDPTKNAETTPPDDEYVDLPCMWAVEFYTPSHVDKLVDNLKKLGWDENELPGRESPASWVRITRQHSEGGSSLYLGTIRSGDDERSWPPRDRTAPLPMYVRYAGGGIYSLTPSLTCIVIRFMFEDNFRCRLDATLRRRRQTFTRPVSRSGREILDPERQKTDEVRRLRQECANLAARWFRENLPGVFSSGLLGDQLPTCELVTLHKAEPFPDRERGEYAPAGYLRVLDLEFSPSVWRSKDTPSLKFSLELLGQNPEYHSIFVVKDTEIEGTKLLEAYGGLPGLATYVDVAYREMIGKVAIRPLLNGYSRRLNKLRDTVTTGIRLPSRKRPFHALKVLIDNFAYDVDIAAVTTDLISSTGTPSRFCHSLKRFESCYDWQTRGSLAEGFRSTVNRHATRLKQTDRSLRDHLTQFGSLIAATEDVRTQNRILWLTVIVAGLAVVTFFSSDADSALVDWLQNIWRHLRWWRG